MTDRISHEDAMGTVAILADTTTPAFQLESAREGLLEYITQQQATETDTVSRVEHEAALNELRRALQETLDKLNIRHQEYDELATKLTALQAEHDLTRAACDAESARVLALQARVAELEAALRELNGAAADLVAEAVGPYDPPQRGSNLERLYRLVSRPASPPPEASAFDGRRYDSMGGYEVQPALDKSSTAYWQRTEHECRSSDGKTCDLCCWAMEEVQPAPGGVERCDECGGPLPEPAQVYCLATTAALGKRFCRKSCAGLWHHKNPSAKKPDPAPADQPRPDYVTRGELVEALRMAEGADGPLGLIAHALEKARKP